RRAHAGEGVGLVCRARRAAGVADAGPAHPRGRVPATHRPGAPTMTQTRQGTFAPAPGAAPLLRQVLAQASMETRLLVRNGEQLLLAVVIPVLALVGGTLAAKRLDLDLAQRPIDVLAPGVLALAVMSTAFTSL